MSTEANTQKVPLIYPFMLVISVTVAALFCYLYLTSPLKPKTQNLQPAENLAPQKQPPIISTEKPQELITANTPSLKNDISEAAAIEEEFTLPSMSSLPGEIIVHQVSAETRPLAQTEAVGKNHQYEQTNYKVQHIIDVELANAKQERVTVEVPVLYQSRGMRWGTAEIGEARRVLRALEIYRDRVKQLKQDGQNIQTAWEKLLLKSQPVDALRADSPSLPENSDFNQNLTNSADAITISHE